MSTVFITGILGQDGSYLAAKALKEGYRVVGGARGHIDEARGWRLRYLGIADKIETVHFDLTDSIQSVKTLKQLKPDYIFNFGAQSSVGDSFHVPIETAEAGGMGALRIFDYAKNSDHHCKVFQASSSEIFGDITDTHHSEDSFFNPKTPYGATKLFAHIMAEAYRASYGTHVSTGILFNHESPIRGENFVTKKIVSNLVKYKFGLIKSFSLGNIEAKRDWSHASDFIDAIWQLMQLDKPNNVVLASGKLHSVKDFVDTTASLLGLTICWEGSGVNTVGIDQRTGHPAITISPEFYRPYDPSQPLADTRKAHSLLNWAPRFSLRDLIDDMIQFELRNT
jgi:GDPmannose 4,6-dehydratase